MKKITLALLSLFLCTAAFAQKHYDRFSKIDVQHYLFELTLTDANDNITGTTEVTIKFKKQIEDFSLDLANTNAQGKGMKVSAVMVDGKKVPFKHANNQLSISYNGKENETKTFSVNYEGIPQTGLIISKNKYGDRTFFGDNWPDRGHHWLPIVDHPSDKATVEWIVAAPSHYQVIGNGSLVERTNIDESTTLTHWKSQVQIPTKVMVIGAARFAIQNIDNVYGTTVSAWVYPQDREKGFYDYALAAPILDWFINHVGPYPYAKLANVQSKTQFGGMENASNIFYSENSIDGTRSSEGLLAHEIAHQWFGNSASEANWHHAWLSEGFATYFTILYMEQKYGIEKANETNIQNRKQVIDFSKQQRVPIVNTAVDNYMNLLNTNSYQKGGWVLHMLRNKIGDQKFWEAIHMYYDRYKLSNALTDDLKEVFEFVSGEDLDSFFQQWVFQAGQPELEAHWNYKQNKLNVEISQSQKENFSFNMEVKILYADGTSEIKTIPVGNKKESWSVTVSKTPTAVVLDPNVKLLFEGSISKK